MPSACLPRLSSAFLPRLSSAFLVVAMLVASAPAPVLARIVGSEESLSSASRASERRAELGAWLARYEVREELLALGVDPAEVEARVAVLGDAEVAELAGKLDQAPAGGSVLGVLATVFIVLLVTDILGFTKVFPFTRTIR
jgi:hypothetical protein